MKDWTLRANCNTMLLFFIEVYAATKKAFAALGEQGGDWLEKTVAMGADGAAVNLGHKGGVIALLQQEAGDFIVPFHCMPHR